MLCRYAVLLLSLICNRKSIRPNVQRTDIDTGGGDGFEITTTRQLYNRESSTTFAIRAPNARAAFMLSNSCHVTSHDWYK